MQSLILLVLYIFIKICYAFLIKITYCRDGQLIWLDSRFEMPAFSGWINRYIWQY